MQSVRQQVLKLFPLVPHQANELDSALASALYALLWSVAEKDVIVDGWVYFRVLRESEDFITAVGLMTLLPSGSAPIEIEINRAATGLSWSARIARLDPAWVALSEPQRWKAVYLYAAGEHEVPQWSWGQKHNGLAPSTDA